MPEQFQKEIIAAQGLDALMDALENGVKRLGFSGFVYWTHLRKPFSELAPGEAFYLSRGPIYLKAFEAAYLASGLYADDPAAHAAAEYTTPYTTREVRAAAEIPSKRMRWLFALEERFGFKYDINVPVHTPLRVQAVNAFCAGGPPELEETARSQTAALQAMATAFCAAVVDFVVLGAVDETAAAHLSRRQQECLTWMAKGRSNREIAEILGLSEATVKFHVAELLQRLHAANRAEAIAIAARQGWIVN